MSDVTRFATRDQLFDAACELLVTALRTALAADAGRATLVLSGGTTPAPLYRRLAQAPLDWARVDVALADERWVPPTDPASNERLLRECFAQGPASAATVVGQYTGHATPEEGLAACRARHAALRRPFAVTVLGMGNDGHTASLFPGATGLPQALAPTDGALLEPIRAPGAPQPRMTLTLPALLGSHSLVLLLTGEDKLATLTRALGPGPLEAMPVRGVLRQQLTPVRLLWAP
jgi:6-phosphogluconolactonase